MKVMILKTDDHLGVKEGEVYDAQRYHLDPHEKVTLLARDPDGYDPSCNQYFDEVAFWIQGQWCRVIDSVYTPMEPQPTRLCAGETEP